VLTGRTDGRDEGAMEIAFEGPGHSLKEYVNFGAWLLSPLLATGSVSSAPSIAQGDANRETEIAFQAPDRTLQLYLPDSLTRVGIVHAARQIGALHTSCPRPSKTVRPLVRRSC
jgi:hypothetical protein